MLFLKLLHCLKVVISSFEPFPSDFEGALRFLHLGGDWGYIENEDAGQFY